MPGGEALDDVAVEMKQEGSELMKEAATRPRSELRTAITKLEKLQKLRQKLAERHAETDQQIESVSAAGRKRLCLLTLSLAVGKGRG